MKSTSEQESLFIARIPRVRAALGLTAQKLTEHIAALGGSISRQGMSRIENGDRGVSLGEALIISEALGVPLDDMINSGPLVVTFPKIEVK